MNLRTHISKQGTLFLAGRTAENNEELINQVKSSENVFHTKASGSPFVNIKGTPKRGDIKEAAIMCARYSRDYRVNKNDILIHRFFGHDINKTRNMKAGTFGVKKVKLIKVKKIDIVNFSARPAKKGELMELLEKNKND